MFGKPRKQKLEEYRIHRERRLERVRIRFEKRAASPVHRAKTKRFLERMQKTYDRGVMHYFLTRGPILFVALSALLVSVVYAMDGTLRQLVRPRVAAIEIIALLLVTWIVTRLGWQLKKPVQYPTLV